jgi:serine/threonine protein kinase
MIDSFSSPTSKLFPNSTPHIPTPASLRPTPAPKYDSFHTFFHLTPTPQIFQYRFLKSIGRGSSATVYLAEDVHTHHKFAAKVYSKKSLFRRVLGGPRAIEKFEREVSIMLTFTHPNILRLHEILDHSDSDSIILITSYCCFGSLLPRSFQSTPISEHRTQKIFTQIVMALHEIHRKRIAHLDIKPENILIDESDSAVLSDFSAAYLCREECGGITRTAGTPAFASPESFSEEPFDPRKADIWSLGVTLFEMLFGRHPFMREWDDRVSVVEGFMNLVNAIRNGLLQWDDVEVSNEVKELIGRMLERDPGRRPTTEEILEHRWVKGIGKEESALGEV